MSSGHLGYYIGAGASANALPVVKDTPASMRELAKSVEEEVKKRGDDLDSDTRKRGKSLVEELWSLSEQAGKSASLDTLARKYHLSAASGDPNGRQKLEKLKKTLSEYLLLEQSRQPVDARYGDFFAYMADWDDHQGRLAMPTDVRVISWNYDMQFEKGYSEFLPQGEKPNAMDALQVFPGVSEKYYCRTLFSIFKLNGTASMEVSRSDVLTTAYDLFVDGDFVETLKRVIGSDREVDARERLSPYLKFAWEDDDRRRQVLDLIVPVKMLVVIGYSFPLFNRDVDRDVLKNLRPQELYVQAGDEGRAVKERIIALTGIRTERITIIEDVGQFFVPHGYSPAERKAPPRRTPA